MGPLVPESWDESPTSGSGVLGEMSDGTPGLGTEELLGAGDRVPVEWVADPVGEGDRPWLRGSPRYEYCISQIGVNGSSGEWVMGTFWS